jgi:ubiquinone/menaquinone biosynthesis C-methylase UbiE
VENAAPGRVDRTDRSFGCVTFAKEHKRAKALNVVVGEAQALPIADGIYDAAVSGLLLNFIPEPQRAVREMARVGKSGSIVAAFVWD